MSLQNNRRLISSASSKYPLSYSHRHISALRLPRLTPINYRRLGLKACASRRRAFLDAQVLQNRRRRAGNWVVVVAPISSRAGRTAPTRTTPSTLARSRSAARTRTAAHIRSAARRNPGHSSAGQSVEHRCAPRFATSCAVSCFAASGPARGRARPLPCCSASEQRAYPSPREPRRARQHWSDAATSRSWQARSAADGSPPRPRALVETFCSAEFCASAGDLTCCGSVGCCAATDVPAVTGREASGATKVRAATDCSVTGRSRNENTVAAPAVVRSTAMSGNYVQIGNRRPRYVLVPRDGYSIGKDHPVERMSEKNEVAPVRTTNDPAQKF